MSNLATMFWPGLYHPDSTEVLLDLYGDDLLTGKVIDLSDHGLHRDAFAVMKVKGIAALGVPGVMGQ